MDDHVAKALKSHTQRIERLSTVIQGTHDLEKRIHEVLDTSAPPKLITTGEETTICNAIQQKTAIAVVGERNCGKSSLINELLGRDVVPVADTPCTSRVVWLRYADNEYIRLLKTDGTVIEGSYKTLLKSAETEGVGNETLRDFAVLKGADRGNESLVGQIVEVGLKHPFLKCGIELIDSPGRNENKTLDAVVDKLLTNKAIPLLIYVIDGNLCVRPEDTASIQFFREKCPQTTILYVCSKADVDSVANEMDAASSDEDDDDDDDDDEDGTHGRQTHSHPTDHPLIIEKRARILRELQRHSFVEGADRRSFHALSIREVRLVRSRDNGEADNGFVQNFKVFKKSLANTLDGYYKKVLSTVVGILERCHSRCFIAFSSEQSSLTEEGEEMTKTLETARQCENQLFTKIKKAVEDVSEDIHKIVENSMQRAKEKLAYHTLSSSKEKVVAFDLLLIHPEVIKKYGVGILCNDKFKRLHKACHEARNFIANSVIHHVESEVGRLLDNEVTSSLWPLVVETMEVLNNPTLRRNLDSVYQLIDSGSDYSEVTSSSLTKLVNSLLIAVKEATIVYFLQTFGVLPMVDLAVELFNEDPSQDIKVDQLSQRLISEVHTDDLRDSILNACNDQMNECHTLFENTIAELEAFMGEVLEQSRGLLGTKVLNIVSDLAVLEIQNQGLKYRGPLATGMELLHGDHAAIHNYKGHWPLGDPGRYVVRVVQNSDAATWRRNLTSLYYGSNCCQSDYLTRICGWTLPEPDILNIVMEKAESSLDKVSLSAKECLDVLLDVVKGIQAIHESGYIYNDLKPKNILLTATKRAKINTCKGNYEILREQAANVDIHQIGELALWLQDTKIPQSAASKPGINVWGSHAIDHRVQSLIDKCTAKHKQITIDDVIRDIEDIVGEY
ncbi:dual serine/threonine and tyrosine protein kinase-like [Glandiceps talaboti]